MQSNQDLQVHLPPIIDLEASGFGSGSYPIEIGFALEDGQVYSMLVKPADNWLHWSEDAEGVHGITREELFANGMEVKDVAMQMNELLVGQTLYTDAWSFDSSWLGRLFDEADIIQRFRLDTINRLLTEDEMERWNEIKKQTIEELGLPLHRAANDVQILQQTFINLKKNHKR